MVVTVRATTHYFTGITSEPKLTFPVDERAQEDYLQAPFVNIAEAHSSDAYRRVSVTGTVTAVSNVLSALH